MTPAAHSEEEIFQQARRIDAAMARKAYLDEACRNDAPLREQVEALLAAFETSQSFLEAPAEELGANLPTRDQSVTERPGTVIGPYKLLQQIGEGGMGVVFMAEQSEPIQRTVALKIIKPGMDTRQVIARFEAERQALALMDHPNIAKVLDAGATDSGRPYFVMELVKGMPITKYCDDHHLAPRERLELFLPVCQAVQHAHQKGIIHRDLKPSNVMIALYDGRPIPKVIDFGVAKATGSKLTDRTMFTEFGAILGTLEYMSPEQAELNQLDVDTRADVYSLGVLLYELLTGTTPLERKRMKATALHEVLRVIREEEPPKPSTRLSTTEGLPSIAANRGMEPTKLSGLVRGELDWIVMKALEKDRNRRYETANGFAADVQRYLHDEAVQACPPSAGYRFRKFARRNKRSVMAASVILLTLISGILGTTIGLIRAEKARQAEVAQRQTAETREAETQAILDFFNDKVFAAAGPEGQDGGLGREVTLLKAVEATLPVVETSFTDKPLIEARLRSTLGQAFLNLGEAGKSADQFQRARTLRTQQLGPDHPDTLASMCSLANSYWHLGRRTEALKLEEETLALCKVKFGPNHRNTLTSMSNLAVTYYDVGRRTEALKLHQDTLALRKAALGPDDLDTLSSMCSVAFSYNAASQHPEALKLYEEALALQKDKLGPDHPDTLRTMQNVAGCYHALDRNAEALKLFEETLAKCKAKLGSDHPLTLWIMDNLARCHSSLGEHRKALKLYEETLALQKINPGPDHPDTFRTMNDLARCHSSLGEQPEAIKLYEETLALQKTKLGPDHPDTLLLMSNLADTYSKLNQHAEAEVIFRDAVAVSQKSIEREPDDPFRRNALAWLLATSPVVEHRNPALAVELAARAAELAPKDATIWNTLGVARYRAGEWQAAIEALAKSMEFRESVDPADWFFLAMSHWQLDQKDEARNWYDKAVEWMDEYQPENEELLRFRTEAAALLGISAPPPVTEAATQP